MQNGESHLIRLFEGCRRGDRNSQRKLYECFYGYAMSICLRYSTSKEEASEILNDAFLKVLTNINKFDPAQPFKPWLRRLLINTAIDYSRKKHRFSMTLELPETIELPAEDLPVLSPDEDLLPILRQLSPAYRIVFNLYVLEEYSHREIAALLDITESASRSNLTRAVEKLRAILTPTAHKLLKTH
ncbi:MAG: sigma-70 family RNA polymerase sigma factor [Saprospiraceae bacterium]|nr:sigma-70 family RNA polymerase sigma factor [Saprospiraceae bacterium]